MSHTQSRWFTRATPLFIAALLPGCGAAVEDGDATETEVESEATAQTEQAISVCGVTPPAQPCSRPVCNSADRIWEYVPKPEGTVCNDTGRCNATGRCIQPPPAEHTVRVAIDDNVRTLVRVLLAGSFVSIDTSGAVPPLVTGSHQECTDPPGPNPLHCWTVVESTNAYVHFSDSLKALYQARSNKTLSDLAFPRLGAVCGGPPFLETCGYVKQIRADLGSVDLALGGSGTRPVISVTLPVGSGHPTLLLGAPYPDVDFTNMRVSFSVSLSAAGGKLVVPSVTGSLAYHRNLVHFPDWLVDGFYDVDGKIQSALDQRITKIFSDEARRETVAAALTRALDQVAQQQNATFKGFKEILAVRVTNGQLGIDYVPKG
jgi:hypothetical protein